MISVDPTHPAETITRFRRNGLLDESRGFLMVTLDIIYP